MSKTSCGNGNGAGSGGNLVTGKKMSQLFCQSIASDPAWITQPSGSPLFVRRMEKRAVQTFQVVVNTSYVCMVNLSVHSVGATGTSQKPLLESVS